MKTHILMALLCSGCATGQLTRFPSLALGAAIGGGSGAVGGVLLSPNDESKGLNALIFGLSGALLGGALGLLTDTTPPTSASQRRLESKEQDTRMNTTAFEMRPSTQLPKFVQERLTPVVVEAYRESDSIGEDGTLHEPHQVYRIKRPAELISKPIQKPVTQLNQNLGVSPPKGGEHE